LRAKNKSFIEDILVIIVVGAIIYAIYSFFFSSEEKVEIEENKTTIENRIEPNKEVTSTEIKKEEEIVSTQIEKSINQPQKEVLSQIENTEPKVEVKEIEKPAIEQTDEKARVEFFYKGIRENINANISKNIDKSQIKSGEFVSIKLTILKSGKYEQLSLSEGNSEYFNLIRSSITDAFPVKIDDTLKDSFPRYFRMKIEF